MYTYIYIIQTYVIHIPIAYISYSTVIPYCTSARIYIGYESNSYNSTLSFCVARRVPVRGRGEPGEWRCFQGCLAMKRHERRNFMTPPGLEFPSMFCRWNMWAFDTAWLWLPVFRTGLRHETHCEELKPWTRHMKHDKTPRRQHVLTLTNAQKGSTISHILAVLQHRKPFCLVFYCKQSHPRLMLRYRSKLSYIYCHNLPSLCSKPFQIALGQQLDIFQKSSNLIFPRWPEFCAQNDGCGHGIWNYPDPDSFVSLTILILFGSFWYDSTKTMGPK